METIELSDAQRTVYVRGINCDFVAEMKAKPKRYIEELNAACNSTLDLTKIRLVNESIKIIVDSADQKAALLTLKKLGNKDKDIEVTQSWSVERSFTQPQLADVEQVRDVNTAPTGGHPCVVYSVPADCAPNEVTAMNGCNWVKCILSLEADADCKTVLLLLASFEDTPSATLLSLVF
jgi:hypothetical protein